MSSISVGAKVECADGPCGELSALVIDRQKRSITHYVVRAPDTFVERMVPSDQVLSSTPSTLRLKCSQAELSRMDPFTRDELLSDQLSNAADDAPGYVYPYYYGYGMGMADVVPPDPQYIHVQVDQVPRGELGLREGTDVLAKDGRIGSVSSLVVNETGTITHVGVDEGHLGKHAILTLPLDAIDHVDDDGVHLKLSKADLHDLPTLRPDDQERVQIVAKVFNSTDMAHEELKWLQLAERKPDATLRIREAAVLVADVNGQLRITQTTQAGIGKSAMLGAGAGGLLALLGPIGLAAGVAIGATAGAVVGPKVDLGLPDAFLKRLAERLDPGHSALVVLVEHDQAEGLSNVLAESDRTLGGQQLVDTLVQEMLVAHA